jgi:hypothetical protein
MQLAAQTAQAIAHFQAATVAELKDSRHMNRRYLRIAMLFALSSVGKTSGIPVMAALGGLTHELATLLARMAW